MIYIGIDPGSWCGWSVLNDAGDRYGSGVWNLNARRHEGGGMRYLRARRYLVELLRMWGQEDIALAYEEVAHHAGTIAAHVYGGVVAVVTAACEEHAVAYRAIPVGTVKKAATGKGNSSKNLVAASAIERWQMTHLDPTKDRACDETDALWIAEALRLEIATPERAT